MPGTIRKILIANRGEIAVRVIRTAKELGIRTVAIYSTADRNSLHRFLADEAYELPGAEAKDTYLNIEKIVKIAVKSKVDAIHPGYGFLSQNALFAKRVAEEGIIFIGPPARIHKLVGNKVEAKRTVKNAGFPVIPGALEPVSDLERAFEIAEQIGYPIILKPALGGGGIGMKVCSSEEELKNLFTLMQKLALSAFGRAEMYIEKYFPTARHIEVQILASKHGEVVHLFERECSIQRRFQKVVEEAPSPALSEDIREKIAQVAVGIAKAINYLNAGTVEFIYVPDTREFFFMELNSRIQVEHPVTEMITGIDIVEQQIRIAEENPLPFSQEDIAIKGHAIEARIYAEDPFNNFAPSPGRIELFVPPSGIGVRVDSAAYSGCEIPPQYDPLVAKLIVWGETREKAIKRMIRALDEFIIEGIHHNIPLHKAIFNNQRFIKGEYDTKFLEKEELKLSKEERKVSLSPIVRSKEPQREVIPVASAWKITSRMVQTNAY